jgi:hypothetical protein
MKKSMSSGFIGNCTKQEQRRFLKFHWLLAFQSMIKGTKKESQKQSVAIITVQPKQHLIAWPTSPFSISSGCNGTSKWLKVEPA